MSEDHYIVIHHDCEIENTDDGVTFTAEEPPCIVVQEDITLLELQSRILEELDAVDKQIKKMLYRMPYCMGRNGPRYRKFRIQKEENVKIMFGYQLRFPEVRLCELYVELEDRDFSSRESAPSILQQQIEPVQRFNEVGQSSRCAGGHDGSCWNEQDDEEHSLSFADMVRQVAQPSVPHHEPLCAVGPSRGTTNLMAGADSDDSDAERDVTPDGSDDDAELSPLTGPSLQQQHMEVFPEHYSALNFSSLRENIPRSHADDAITEGLVVGRIFRTKEAAQYAIKTYSIKTQIPYKVYESNPTKLHCRCVQFGNGCNWNVRVILRKKTGMWEIRKLEEPHTCVFANVPQFHPQLDYHVICSNICDMIQQDPTVSVKVLQIEVEKKFGAKTTYRKVWMAKQKAIAQIFGDWEASYKELPRWLLGLQTFMPGTVVMFQTKPFIGASGDNVRMFQRVFWSFPPCIAAFPHCKRFISIDGTHLYGKYRGTLLMAIAQDGNSNILPLAFALVEGENREAWNFFLANLRQHVTPQQGILVISDRHKAIKAVLDSESGGWVPPAAYHAYCIRHIASNFAVKFKSKEGKEFVKNAGYAKTYNEFMYWHNQLTELNPSMAAWVDKIPHERWTQYADGGRRFGHMTTNLSECINSVMKGTRSLPITAIVRSTYFRLVQLFLRKGTEAQAQLAAGERFSEFLRDEMDKHRKVLHDMHATRVTRESLQYMILERGEVDITSQRTFRVSLSERTCDCGAFQSLHYPCRHAFAACVDAHLDWGSFVHDVYRMESVYNVYRTEFAAIASEDLWPVYNGPVLRPNPALMRRAEGRPNSTRIRNEMDEVEASQPKRCGLCRQPGHSRRSCPVISSSTSSNTNV